jgi:DnaJ-class molecular chaperone
MDINPEAVYVCDKCKGEGVIKAPYNIHLRQFTCDKCKGTGSVDWIENIVGRKLKDGDFSSGIESW